jgi:preprotein translocase subunit SecA
MNKNSLLLQQMKLRLSDSNLNLKTEDEIERIIHQLKCRGKKESLDSILPEWFGIVQEVSRRKIGFKHFDSQLLAGLMLHQGKVIEMKTGEGKTLASTLPVSLNAILEKGVHVVTVNDYLAERDQKWMGKIYEGLGFSVGLVNSISSVEEKKRSYSSDITYVTNSELVFDYLRDSSADFKEDVVQRPFSFCIIDEIDSILIDEARTPLILSTLQENVNNEKLQKADFLANFFSKKLDFELEEKTKDIYFTEFGYKKALNILGKTTLYEPTDSWILQLLNALKAKHIFKKNKDYIVLNNKICIVDEFTGRVMSDRRWSLGIHEAIETKEQVEIEGSSKTKNSITYQNFFLLYPKLAGMTGTAMTAKKEFEEIYKLKVVEIPTQKVMVRKDLEDFVYTTEMSKWKAVVRKANDCFITEQPILIGTTNVEKSELLSNLLKSANIPHQLLNAKPENVERESEIVALAGERQAVTIATNMAGRGTDIILGGNPLFQAKQKIWEILITKTINEETLTFFISKIEEEYENNIEDLKLTILNLPYSLETCSKTLQIFYNLLEKDIQKNWQIENEYVKQLGGLFVLGTERHENRRIDNQLRGRAGRQGDPGFSQFYLSLEDELIQIFGGENIQTFLKRLGEDENDEPLESGLLTYSLEKAQKKVENYNYDIRKNVFEYDEIVNNQRIRFFKIRNEILNNSISPEDLLCCFEIFFRQIKKEKRNLNWYKIKIDKIEDHYSYVLTTFKNLKGKKKRSKDILIGIDIQNAQASIYEQDYYQLNRTQYLLRRIDWSWTEHLERMNYIRETVNWRSYGQQNPLMEYNLEAVNSFQILLYQIQLSVLYYFSYFPMLESKRL